MKSVYTLLKILLLCGLPLVLLACLYLDFLYPGHTAVNWAFSIALAGLVGIGTNSLAIRMLFRPLRPTIFGRQGLIPKNKSVIAASIATETEKRLLNIEIIMQHIERERIVEQTIESVVAAAERYLSREENRRIVTDNVLRLYNHYADRLFTWLTRSAEAWLIELAKSPGTVERIWAVVKPRLKTFFESEQLKRQTAGWILEHLVARAPELADMLAQALDRYIAEQTPWKQLLLQGVRRLSGIRPAEIEQMLLDFLHNPDTYTMVVGLVENNLQAVESYFKQDQVQERVQHLQKWLEEAVLNVTRSRAIPALRERIDTWLSEPEAWMVIDRYAQDILKTVPPRLQQFLQRPENIKKIQDIIPEIIERLNIRKIVADNIEGQRTEDFETMILKVAGENLAAIEVLGGLIGMLAGLALHKPIFLLVLPVGLGTLLGLEKSLSAFRRK
jgi:uncharacterized membrane protein YheB (UPF0754 family)